MVAPFNFLACDRNRIIRDANPATDWLSLVVFPNARRAGKSTLTACLAKTGRPVFSDDFLPINFSPDGMILGTTNGINPRLRLPVPNLFSAEFRTWISDDPGLANKQYKYLRNVDVPPHGRAQPIGALVFLDRQDTGTESPVAISGTDDTTTIENLLRQNFARHVHSRTILVAMQALHTAIPVHRLTFSSAESLAALLQRTFARWTAPVPLLEDVEHLRFQPVDPEMSSAERPVFDRTMSYVQATETSVALIGGSHYLADGSGLGI